MKIKKPYTKPPRKHPYRRQDTFWTGPLPAVDDPQWQPLWCFAADPTPPVTDDWERLSYDQLKALAAETQLRIVANSLAREQSR
jgi:hypothetical protein